MKTRLMKRHQRQEVTGVVVNEKLQVPRITRRDLRQAIYYIERFGLDYHLGRIEEKRANYVWHLRGLCAHILFINPRDRDALNALKVLGNGDATSRA